MRRYLEWGAGTAGNVAGIARSPERAARGLVETAGFGLRLLDPTDALRHPPGQAAWDTVDSNVRGLAKRLVDVQGLPKALKRGVEHTRSRYLPSATPSAIGLQDEMRRRFEIGFNQGELAFDVATAGIGGPFAKSKLLQDVRLPALPSKYEAQGFSPEFARYLAKPYSGMGSHFIPKRLTHLFGTDFIESDFNVSRPFGISQGDHYEYHYGVDDRFHGAGSPKRFGAETWSGKRIGAPRFDPVTRLWVGAPVPLRARMIGGGAFGGAIVASDHETREP